MAATSQTARALDGHGRLVVLGASPRGVKARCGEPTALEDVIQHLAPRAYGPISQSPANIVVPLQQRIWIDNVGPTRFLYGLTFQDGKWLDITTGDHDH